MENGNTFLNNFAILCNFKYVRQVVVLLFEFQKSYEQRYEHLALGIPQPTANISFRTNNILTIATNFTFIFNSRPNEERQMWLEFRSEPSKSRD